MSKDFWKAALIRAGYTWIQAFLAAIPTTASVLSDVNWKIAFSAATLAAVLSLGKSIIVGLPEAKLYETLYDLDNDPFDEEDDIEEVGDGTEYDEEGDE